MATTVGRSVVSVSFHRLRDRGFMRAMVSTQHDSTPPLSPRKPRRGRGETSDQKCRAPPNPPRSPWGSFRLQATNPRTGRLPKGRGQSRSTGFRPAVSPISNRLGVEGGQASLDSWRLQAGSPAIQQVGNLRYLPVVHPYDGRLIDFVHGPGRLPNPPRQAWGISTSQHFHTGALPLSVIT
jgi:hypothetical protein